MSLRIDLLAIADLIQPQEKVLDLGCDDGELLRHLIDTRQITGRGVELSEEGVLACVHRGLSVRQGDLQEGLSDYPNGSFDTIILSQTLPFLDNPAFIIREMLRVGKRAVVSFPNWGHWQCRLGFLLTGHTQIPPDFDYQWDEAPRARPLTVGDFGRFCTHHEFHITQQIYFRGQTSLPNRIDKNLRATVAIFELRNE